LNDYLKEKVKQDLESEINSILSVYEDYIIKNPEFAGVKRMEVKNDLVDYVMELYEKIVE
jgi:hypothetical protein